MLRELRIGTEAILNPHRSSGSSRPSTPRSLATTGRQAKYGVDFSTASPAPASTVMPILSARPTRSATSRDLPIPASPSITTSPPEPATRDSRWASRRRRSAALPMRGDKSPSVAARPLGRKIGIGSDLPLKVTGGRASKTNRARAAWRVAGSHRMVPGAACISRAARLTLSPITVYSRRPLPPISPQ